MTAEDVIALIKKKFKKPQRDEIFTKAKERLAGKSDIDIPPELQ